jgi:hypothetical protein
MPRGQERLAGGFGRASPAPSSDRKSSQFFIDKRQELFGGVRIAFVNS